jgi:polysaccharide export outer membrane protein
MRAVDWILLMTLGLAIPGFPQKQPSSADFPIGPADLLSVSVLGVADFSGEYRVGNPGTIRMPFVGEFRVAGLMPSQVEAKLAELLHPNYVKDPQISVTVKEPRSRMYSILGAVMRPGQYPIVEPIMLTGAIAEAGGLNYAKSGDQALIQRKAEPEGGKSTISLFAPASSQSMTTAPLQIEASLRNFLRGDNTALDVPIIPGDIIVIPEREEISFFVIGDVTKPGSFEYPKDHSLKLSRALAIAGGPTKTSKMKAGALIRQGSSGSVMRLDLNLDRVLSGKDPDIDLFPNDMLFVPGSYNKQMGMELLKMLPYAVISLLPQF